MTPTRTERLEDKPLHPHLLLYRPDFQAEGRDGTGQGVKVLTDLALQPGLAVFERYFDPAKDPEVKVQGEEVVSYPKLPNLQPLTLRVEKYRVYDDRLYVTGAERIG